MTKYIAILMLIASVACGQNRVWSNGAYGKVDPREYLPESLYTNCVAWYCMNQNPAQFATWGVPDGGIFKNSAIQTTANSRPTHTNMAYGALSFDGVDDFILASTNAILNTSGSNVSAFAWVYLSEYRTNNPVVSQYDTATGHRGWRLTIGPYSGVQVIVSKDGAGSAVKNYQSTNSLALNSWNMIGFVWNAGSLAVFQNGYDITASMLKPANATFSSISDLNAQIRICDSVYLKGIADSIIIFRNSISTSDVNALYQSTRTIHP